MSLGERGQGGHLPVLYQGHLRQYIFKKRIMVLYDPIQLRGPGNFYIMIEVKILSVAFP